MTHRIFLSALTLVMLCPALSACNTVEGVGQDLQQAGRSVQDAAHKNQ